MSCALIGLPSPDLVEIAGHAGFDFAILDAEHGAIDVSDLVGLVRAADAVGLPTIVRVPEVGRAFVSRSLDAGAKGILAPETETIADAQALLNCCRYAPIGIRGVAHYTRAFGYSKRTGFEQFAEADGETIAAVNIETPLGMQHAQEIAALPGIDLLVPGPFDFRMRLGNASNADSQVQTALIRVGQWARQLGRSAVVPTGDPESARELVAAGYNIMLCSMTTLVQRSSADFVRGVRNVLSEQAWHKPS